MELISFLQDLLAASFDKCIEFGRELSHAIAQVFESKVDAGQRVGHGRGIRRGERRAHATRRQ